LLSFENINLSYDHNKIFENLNISFKHQQITCLFGPSGIGKTSILNLLAGILKPDSGKVNVPVTTRIGYVFQEPRLLPWCNVRENLGIGLYATDMNEGQRYAAIEEMIEQLSLTGYDKHYPAQLSGGMKQRVALGRAFVIAPELLLLDEPFSALDEALKLEMRNLLHNLIEWFPCTTVFVTHDFMEAIFLSDWLILMNKRPCNNPTVLQIDSSKRDDQNYINELELKLMGGRMKNKIFV